MRVPTPVFLASLALLVGACGDDPKPSSKNSNAAKFDAAESRLIGLHEKALDLRARGQFEQALVAFDELLVLSPNDLRVRFNRAAVLAELARPQEALAVYDQMLQLTPNDPQLFQNRAAVLQDLGRNEEALVELDRAMSGLPDSPVLRVLRADILTKLGRAQEALSELDRADLQLASTPEQVQRSKLGAQALLFRVEALEALGRAADGAQALERLRSTFQNEPHLAELLKERGRL